MGQFQFSRRGGFWGRVRELMEMVRGKKGLLTGGTKFKLYSKIDLSSPGSIHNINVQLEIIGTSARIFTTLINLILNPWQFDCNLGWKLEDTFQLTITLWN
jgi:hypothetical protein